MRLIPPELTTAILTALSIASAWFATWLARRGKREDTKIAEAGQAFNQLKELAEARSAEIARLTADLAAARADIDRVRGSWESRWERQMTRCRNVTDSLIRAIDALKLKAGADAEREAAQVHRALAQHDEDDHSGI